MAWLDAYLEAKGRGDEEDVYKRQGQGAARYDKEEYMRMCGNNSEDHGRNQSKCGPVSYTHLDVYKRQAEECSQYPGISVKKSFCFIVDR